MQTNKLSHSGAMSQFRRRRCRLCKPAFASPRLPAFWCALSPAGVLTLAYPLLCQNPNQEMRAVDSSDLACLEEEEDDKNGDFHDWALETCITRVLPQALTLEHGLEALNEVFNELKLNPPTTSSGLIRFEVAVPPKSKAYSWFYAEPESSEVFPQFYISKEPNITTHQSADLNNTRGIFGIGAAVDFGHLSSGNIGNWSLFRSVLQILDG